MGAAVCAQMIEANKCILRLNRGVALGSDKENDKNVTIEIWLKALFEKDYSR